MTRQLHPWQLPTDIPEDVQREVAETNWHVPQCGICASSTLDELLENCESVDNDHPNDSDCLLLPRDGKEVDDWLRRVLRRDGWIVDVAEVVDVDDTSDNLFGDTIVTDGPPTGEQEVVTIS